MFHSPESKILTKELIKRDNKSLKRKMCFSRLKANNENFESTVHIFRYAYIANRGNHDISKYFKSKYANESKSKIAIGVSRMEGNGKSKCNR